MSESDKDETKRGYQEATKQFEALREKWPAAFPAKSYEVRPLALSGAASKVAETLGWSTPYALAVLRIWKLREAYCRAVLAYPRRLNLDGSDSGVEVDDVAREQAKAQLLRIAATAAKKKAKRERALTADRPAAAADTSPFEAKPPAPPQTPVETAGPAELPQPRKLAGSAAMEAALKRRLAGGPVLTQTVATIAAPPPKPAPAKRAQR